MIPVRALERALSEPALTPPLTVKVAPQVVVSEAVYVPDR